MIARTWHGVVPLRYEEQFTNYLEETGVKDAKLLLGNHGAYTHVVVQGEYVHFFLCTYWETMENVITYAGDKPEIAVTYPADKDYKLISDPVVIHLEVNEAKNPFLK
ncbi:MAG: hypothetical protein RR614_07250 [Eubacterium sp.]